MGYEKEAYLNWLYHYTGKKDFKESTPKIQMLMFGLPTFSISYMYNTKSDHFSPKIKPYIYGNRKLNAYHKI